MDCDKKVRKYASSLRPRNFGERQRLRHTESAKQEKEEGDFYVMADKTSRERDLVYEYVFLGDFRGTEQAKSRLTDCVVAVSFNLQFLFLFFGRSTFFMVTENTKLVEGL